MSFFVLSAAAVAAPGFASPVTATRSPPGRGSVVSGVVGIVLLAVTTSFPEIVVSITSVRAGSYDLAVGNLLGSNCFNMAVLLPLDIAHGLGPVARGRRAESRAGGGVRDPHDRAGAPRRADQVRAARVDARARAGVPLLAYATGVYLIYRAG